MRPLFFSSLAYGAVESDLGWLVEINRKFLAPDLTVFIDVLPQTCIQRMADGGRSFELFEKKAILEKVRRNYLAVIEKFNKSIRIETIDGNLSREEVFKNILDIMDKFK